MGWVHKHETLHSALIDELVLREHERAARRILLVGPNSEIGVAVRFGVLLDVFRRREVHGIASDIGLALGLIHADPVDAHACWEGEVLEVDVAETVGDTKVGDQVHRFLRDGPVGNLDTSVCLDTTGHHRP